jgi:hypothetical protein
MSFEPGKKQLFLDISLHQHRYTGPIDLLVRRNPHHKSYMCVVSAISTLPFQRLRHLRNVCHPVVNHFMPQTLPTVNRKHFFMNILCIESFCLQKTHNRTLLFGSTFVKHGRPFGYWNQPLNMRMRIRYLDCHAAGMCCYLVIHIENLLRPLQLLYFHLWHNCWLFLVHRGYLTTFYQL